MMIPMVASILGIGCITAAMILAAGAHMHITHMALAAIMAMILAFAAMVDNQKSIANSETTAQISGQNARYMGLVWAWGALVLAITYGTGVLVWKEWWQFLIAFVVAASLCLFFAIQLRDQKEAIPDETTTKVSRYLAIAQLGGAVIAMIGLLVDGKMTRFLNPRHMDWAANNVFFFGALALAIISYLALRSHAKSEA